MMVLLLCCLVVFFFKQKTAYEMRISDWSSDVCSSDLGPEVDPDGPCRWIAVAGRAVGDLRVEHPAVSGPRDEPLGAEFHRHFPLQHQEIGRASCRARVCQYV